MAICYGKEMDAFFLVDVWSDDEGVLVDFVWVVRVEAYSGGEGELPDAVLALLLCRPLHRLMGLGLFLLVPLQLGWRSCWATPTRWVVRLRDLLPRGQAWWLGASGCVQHWLL